MTPVLLAGIRVCLWAVKAGWSPLPHPKAEVTSTTELWVRIQGLGGGGDGARELSANLNWDCLSLPQVRSKTHIPRIILIFLYVAFYTFLNKCSYFAEVRESLCNAETWLGETTGPNTQLLLKQAAALDKMEPCTLRWGSLRQLYLSLMTSVAASSSILVLCVVGEVGPWRPVAF